MGLSLLNKRPRPMSLDILKVVAEETETPESEWELGNGPESGVGTEYYVFNHKQRIAAYVCVDQGEIAVLEIQDYDEHQDVDVSDDDGMTDVEADAQTLAMAGWGTDEDYGHFHDHLERDHDEPYIPEQDN